MGRFTGMKIEGCRQLPLVSSLSVLPCLHQAQKLGTTALVHGKAQSRSAFVPVQLVWSRFPAASGRCCVTPVPRLTLGACAWSPCGARPRQLQGPQSLPEREGLSARHPARESLLSLGGINYLRLGKDQPLVQTN